MATRRNLRLKLIHPSTQSEFFESGRSLGEEDQVHAVVRPVWDLYLDGRHAELLHVLDGVFVDLSRGILIEPLREVADAQALDGRGSVEVEMTWNDRENGGIRSRASAQHQHGVFDWRVIGPSLSSVQQRVIAPVRGTRP